MRINDLLTESNLSEGPIGQAVAKGVGGLAKGVGAVAGGIAGIPGAVKKGFKAGKTAVQGEPNATAPAAPATADQTQAAPADADTGIISQFKKGFAKGRNPAAAADQTQAAPAAGTTQPASGLAAAQPAAETPPTAAAAPAATPAPAAADPAAEKASKIGVGQINKIIPTLRTRDLMSLQANLEKTIASKKKTPATTAPAAAPAEQPAAGQPAVKRNPNNPDDLGFGFDVDTGLPLKSQAEKDANIAKADAAEKAAAQTTAAPVAEPAKKTRSRKKAAPSQAEIDADRENNPNIQMSNNSVVRTGNNLSETLARKVEEQKRKMFESSLVNGTASIFKK
jgi:hypothetical protein